MRKVSLNKIDELSYRLYLTQEFQKNLVKLRDLCGVPEKGFKTWEDYCKWIKNASQKKKDYLCLSSELWTIKKKIPPDARFLIQNYVLFGTEKVLHSRISEEEISPDIMQSCEIELSNEVTKRWKRSRIPFVKIIISKHASQRDIKNFISINWDLIELLFSHQNKNQNQKQTQIRSLKNREIQEEVIKLSKLTLKELREVAPQRNGKYWYKEETISAIIRDKMGLNITSGNVKTIIARRKK